MGRTFTKADRTSIDLYDNLIVTVNRTIVWLTVRDSRIDRVVNFCKRERLEVSKCKTCERVSSEHVHV